MFKDNDLFPEEVFPEEIFTRDIFPPAVFPHVTKEEKDSLYKEFKNEPTTTDRRK